MKKSYLWTAVKYGLGLGLLALVIWRYWDSPDGGQTPGLADALQRPINYGPLFLASVICLFSLVLTFFRWYVLVRAQELPFTMWNALRLGWIGFALSTFLPGSVGGDIIKAAFLAKEQSRRTVAVATVIFDRIIGLCGLFWLVALLGVFFWGTGQLDQVATHPQGRTVLMVIIGSCVALALGSFVFWWSLGLVSLSRIEPIALWLSRCPKIGHSLAEAWRALLMYRQRGHSIRLGMGMALIGHIGFILTFYFSALTLCPPEDVPNLGSSFLVVPVGMTIQAGVPTPGGVGGGEAAFGWLYHLLGYTIAAGVLASLVQRVIAWALGLVGYLAYLWMKPSLPVVETDVSPEPPVETMPQEHTATATGLNPSRQVSTANLQA